MALGNFLRNQNVFQPVKYLVYTALLVNVFLFMAEEMMSSAALNTSVTSIASFFQIFSATIDTGAWLVLLIFFELETYVLSDHLLRSFVGWFIRGIKFLCLAAITVAWWGYIAELSGLMASQPMSSGLCETLDASWSVLINLDQFEPFSASACGADEWLVLTDYERVIASPAFLQSAVWLAALDVINASAWILVVIVLEIEVRVLLSRQHTLRLLSESVQRVKTPLYLILFLAAVYWGFEGSFLDFWDAILWLFAFFVIEGNMSTWRDETGQSQEAGT
ncbi:MAG: shikimate kinase [Halieaceae bacterium]|jgi:hypothetical protein|nr:shikimate kinase [Halieaceae bacterium]